MVKRDLPAYVYRKGRRRYPYFIRDGVCERMPEPSDPAFWTRYAALLRNPITAPAKRTMKGLIASYMRSQKWAKLAPATQKSYRASLRYIEEKSGHLEPATFRRLHVIQMRDAMADKPTTANRRIGALSVLFEHAIDIDWLAENPAKGVSMLEGKRPPRQPWPADMIEKFRAAADPETLLLFEMLLGTGQRVSDVLRMQWGHIEDGGIVVTQGKTRRKLWVPLTDRLRSALEAAPKRGLHIVTQRDGKPVGYSLAARWVLDVRKRIGAEAWDIHALRHSAASEIAALPGMTDEHVRAITGHSSGAMVRLYAGAAQQRARATEAQKRRK